jgi:hypothetical protein
MCIACAHRVCVCVCVCVLWCWAMHLYAIFSCLMRALIADTRAPSSRALIFAHELYCCPRFVLLSTLCIVVHALYCCPRFVLLSPLCIVVHAFPRLIIYVFQSHWHTHYHTISTSGPTHSRSHCHFSVTATATHRAHSHPHVPITHTSCPLTPSRPHHSHIVSQSGLSDKNLREVMEHYRLPLKPR